MPRPLARFLRHPSVRFTMYVAAPCLVTGAFWLVFTAALFASSGCVIDSPADGPAPPIARLVVAWDPLACTPASPPAPNELPPEAPGPAPLPHRVVIELEDEDGIALAKSTPCNAGSLSFDTSHFGVYYGRIYAWTAGEDIRSVMPVRLVVDEPVARWWIATPP